jgi:hypothetical protein
MPKYDISVDAQAFTPASMGQPTRETSMSGHLPDIGSVETTQLDGLQIRFARSGKADGIPVLLTSPWPESIYAFRDVLSEIGKLNR